MDKQKDVQQQIKSLKILVLLLCFILAVLIGVLIYLLSDRYGSELPSADISATEGITETENVEETFATIPVDTSSGLLFAAVEQGKLVEVESVFGKIQYPSQFSDLLQIDPVVENDEQRLEFYGRLENGNYLLYTLWFGVENGHDVGTITDSSGETITVYLEVAEAAEDLTETDLESFYAAQETLNDVLASLGLS